ncbi:MAG: hypothetical protein WD116_05580 [Chloroflexota bacterium]
MQVLEMVDMGDDRLIGAGCTLDSAEMPARLREWADLRDRSASVREIPGGAVIGLAPSEPMGQLAELAARESECCPFYTFRIRIDGATRELEITAGEGREIAVQALLGIG